MQRSLESFQNPGQYVRDLPQDFQQHLLEHTANFLGTLLRHRRDLQLYLLVLFTCPEFAFRGRPPRFAQVLSVS